MKKLLIALFVLGLSLPAFSQLEEKDIIGKWTFSLETDQGALTGNFSFELKEGELTGEVSTDMGDVLPFTKVEIRENDVLYLELQPEYDVYEITLTVKDKKYEGTVETVDITVPITGEKVE